MEKTTKNTIILIIALFLVIFMFDIFMNKNYNITDLTGNIIKDTDLSSEQIEIPIFPEEENKEEIDIDNLKEKLSSLEQELKKYKLSEISPEINLRTWTEEQIVKAMSFQNEKFSNTKWFNYQYREDDSFYHDVGEVFPVDPFVKITFSKRNRELSQSHLRIFDLGPEEKEYLNEYENYKAKISRELILDKDLICFQQQLCKDLFTVSCKKNNEYFYIWFSKRYIITAREQKGEALKAFQTFYCAD